MKKIFIITFILCFFSYSAAVAQTDYTLLEPIGDYTGETTQANSYLAAIFKLAIGIASGLAVIMIIWGGIQYMSTDAISGKGEAKNTIQNAIWGLLLAIGAWLILFTINPQLVEFNLNLTAIEQQSETAGGGEAGN